MKKIILSVFLLTTLLVQAQINHYFYINVENEEKFEEVFQDYQFSKDHSIKLPERKISAVSNISLVAA